MENRIIKFRAWDKKMSTMHDLVGFLIFKEFTEIHFGTSGFKKLRPDEVELLAFTGLKDKNGKEIYEGDIILWPHLTDQKNQVYYNQKECAFFAKPIDGDDKTESYLGGDCEVIGNIYENKDLL